jgi:aminoglycoside phosphotransferase (APT) family kinase protein
MTNPDDQYLERLVDEEALASYLTSELGPTDTYEVSHHQEGHSNETLFVTWGDTDLVIRRPPPGEIAETAHDVLREYRVIDALQDTPVRVPRTILACEDLDVIGTEFYAMERATGDVLHTEGAERFATNEHRAHIGTELVDSLADIHAVDYDDIGLEEGEFGTPDGFTRRQVDRWEKLIHWASEVTTSQREITELDTVAKWLLNNVPQDPPSTLVHGDYKLDNVMFGSGVPPRVSVIFDWELATLSDPCTDLGWMLTFWRDEGDPDPPDLGLYSTFTARDGYLSRVELVDRYESVTGLTFDHERFYRTLAVFKMAGLGEMFYRRFLEGNSDDPLYPLMANGVPQLATRALGIIEGDEPL